jgi:hypothetical protein
MAHIRRVSTQFRLIVILKVRQLAAQGEATRRSRLDQREE